MLKNVGSCSFQQGTAVKSKHIGDITPLLKRSRGVEFMPNETFVLTVGISSQQVGILAKSVARKRELETQFALEPGLSMQIKISLLPAIIFQLNDMK